MVNDWKTVSAAKHVDCRKSFGVYVVDGPGDAVRQIWDVAL